MYEVRFAGQGDWQAFGMPAEERMRRQLKTLNGRTGGGNGIFVCRRDTLVIDTTLEWLARNPRRFLLNEQGAPVVCFLAIGTDAAIIEAAAGVIEGAPLPDSFTLQPASELSVFSRTLRARQRLTVMSLAQMPRLDAERVLFQHVYKGVVDFVTRHVWPVPAFWTTRALAYRGISPNAVTIVGILLALLAAYAFAMAHWGIGLAAAWIVTFLDTVDGKLARVTVTSSPLGNRLDHVSDWIHPPLWWLCVAVGAGMGGDLEWRPSEAESLSITAILVSYFGGRIAEKLFKRRFGFNQFLWRPSDALLRSVIARRNTILLVLTAGAVLHEVQLSIDVIAIWCVLSIGLQVSRWLYAEWQAMTGHPIESWIQGLDV